MTATKTRIRSPKRGARPARADWLERGEDDGAGIPHGDLPGAHHSDAEVIARAQRGNVRSGEW